MSWDYSLHDRAKMIDHSLLNPTFTEEQLEQGIQVALSHDVASVCIMPFYLRRCAELLRGSDVRACWLLFWPCGSSF